MAPVVRPLATTANASPVVISCASISTTLPVVCSESIRNARAAGLAVVSKLMSSPMLACVPSRSPACSILTNAPALSVVLASCICNPVPVVRLSMCMCNPLPVLTMLASISATTPSLCSESILNARAFGFTVVSKLMSNPMLACVPVRLPSCSILTKLPALSLV